MWSGEQASRNRAFTKSHITVSPDSEIPTINWNAYNQPSLGLHLQIFLSEEKKRKKEKEEKNEARHLKIKQFSVEPLIEALESSSVAIYNNRRCLPEQMSCALTCGGSAGWISPRPSQRNTAQCCYSDPCQAKHRKCMLRIKGLQVVTMAMDWETGSASWRFFSGGFSGLPRGLLVNFWQMGWLVSMTLPYTTVHYTTHCSTLNYTALH